MVSWLHGPTHVVISAAFFTASLFLPSLIEELKHTLSTTNVHAKHNKCACSKHTRQWCCEGPLYKCPGGASCQHQQPGVREEVALPWAGAAQVRHKAIDLLQRASKPSMNNRKYIGINSRQLLAHVLGLGTPVTRTSLISGPADTWTAPACGPAALRETPQGQAFLQVPAFSPGFSSQLGRDGLCVYQVNSFLVPFCFSGFPGTA